MSCLGSIILAFGLYNIHAVSDITEGGILGLQLLLRHWLGISPAISGLVMNCACYILGIVILGRGFIAGSVVACCSYSAAYRLFEQFPPVCPQIVHYPLAACILGALFVGLGVGMSIRAGGAPGGDDALAMALNKLTGIGIETVYLVGDLAVLLLSLSYIPLRRIAYSLLTVVLSGQLAGLMADPRGYIARFRKTYGRFAAVFHKNS